MSMGPSKNQPAAKRPDDMEDFPYITIPMPSLPEGLRGFKAPSAHALAGEAVRTGEGIELKITATFPNAGYDLTGAEVVKEPGGKTCVIVDSQYDASTVVAMMLTNRSLSVKLPPDAGPTIALRMKDDPQGHLAKEIPVQ